MVAILWSPFLNLSRTEKNLTSEIRGPVRRVSSACHLTQKLGLVKSRKKSSQDQKQFPVSIKTIISHIWLHGLVTDLEEGSSKA